MEILGDGVLFFSRRKRKHTSTLSRVESWNLKGQRVNSSSCTRQDVHSFAQSRPEEHQDWPRLFVLIRETRNYSCVWMIVRMTIDVFISWDVNSGYKILAPQEKYSAQWISSSTYFIIWTIVIFYRIHKNQIILTTSK